MKGNAKENAGCGAIYVMGFMGALLFFLIHSTSFMDGLFGIAKAIFWPGVIVYKVLEILYR
jgi:hypothetical protein